MLTNRWLNEGKYFYEMLWPEQNYLHSNNSGYAYARNFPKIYIYSHRFRYLASSSVVKAVWNKGIATEKCAIKTLTFGTAIMMVKVQKVSSRAVCFRWNIASICAIRRKGTMNYYYYIKWTPPSCVHEPNFWVCRIFFHFIIHVYINEAYESKHFGMFRERWKKQQNSRHHTVQMHASLRRYSYYYYCLTFKHPRCRMLTVCSFPFCFSVCSDVWRVHKRRDDAISIW